MLQARRIALLLSLAMIALATSSARAVSVPGTAATAAVIVDGETFDLSEYISYGEDRKIARLSAQIEANGNQIFVTGLYNADPFITFGITTINGGPGPVAYSFIFGTPVVPGLYNHATSTGGVSVTNGVVGTSTVDNGGIYAPSYISGYGSVGAALTNLGVDLGVGAVTATGVPFTVTTTTNFGSLATTFPLTFYDNLEAIVSYTQTDTASSTGWTGAVTLNRVAIPEPTSVIMFGMGALILGATHLRRRAV